MVRKFQTVTEEVDEFIEHYQNLDYVIKPEAQRIIVKAIPLSVGVQTSDFREASISDWLSLAVTNYMVCRDSYEINQESKEELQRVASAQVSCLIWKNRLIGYGLLVEAPSLTTKLKQSEIENQELKEQLKKCDERCQQLTEENKVLRESIDKISYPGDVFRDDNKE